MLLVSDGWDSFLFLLTFLGSNQALEPFVLLHRSKAPLCQPVKFQVSLRSIPKTSVGDTFKDVHSRHFTLHSKPNYFHSSSIKDKLIYSRSRHFPALYSSSVEAVLQAFVNPSPLIQPSFYCLTPFFLIQVNFI